MTSPQTLQSQTYERDLIVAFLADVMRSTRDAASPDAFQQALQTYCDSLRLWLEPSDGPPHPRAVFSLFDNCTFDESGDHVSVVFSPKAEALFRAWLRRNKICSEVGLQPHTPGPTENGEHGAEAEVLCANDKRGGETQFAKKRAAFFRRLADHAMFHSSTDLSKTFPCSVFPHSHKPPLTAVLTTGYFLRVRMS